MNRGANRPPPPAAIPASARQNEYFVPRDGIDREVITSDICRYLGNDALVRPGTYESPDGRVTQGYYITAYRNLTSAMIQDLKADSARWEQERRAASRTGGGGAGGTMHSSQPNGMFMRGSNSPLGAREQPRGQADYTTWKNQQLDRDFRQQQHHQQDAMDVDPYQAPPANIGVNPNYAPGLYGPGPNTGYSPAPYPAVPGGSAPFPGYVGYPANPPLGNQYSPPPSTADRYAGIPGPPLASSYAPEPAFVQGSNFNNAGGYGAQGPNRMTMPLSSAPPSRAFNATAGGPPYGTGVDPTDPFGYNSGTGNMPNPGPFGPNLSNPVDVGYGRQPNRDTGGSLAVTAPRTGYGAVPDPQFDERQSPSLPNAPTPTNGTTGQQIPPPGQQPARRDAEPRDRERGHRDHRDDRGARRTEPDRDDRHAAERARHRQHR